MAPNRSPAVIHPSDLAAKRLLLLLSVYFKAYLENATIVAINIIHEKDMR